MSEEAPKLRLRPKLAADSAPAVPPAAPPPAESAAATPPDASAQPGEPHSIRLKPRVPAEPPSPTPVGTPPTAAFAAVVPQPLPPSSPPLLSPAAQTSVPPSAADAVDSASAASTPLEDRSRKVRRAALIIVGAGAVVFAGVSAVAFPRLVAKQAKEDAAAARLEKLLRSDREAENSDDQETAAPADSRPKTATKPSPQPPSSGSATPAASTKSPAAAAPVVSSLALPTTEDARASADPSIAFRTWVQELKIAGLRTGASPRILIGRASYNVGDTVNIDLGIVFDGYDAERRMLRFKDANGTVVERRHP